MSRFLVGSVLTLALLPSTTFGQPAGGGRIVRDQAAMQAMRASTAPEPQWPAQRWLVKVETLSGKNVLGTLTVSAVPISCDLGRYYIRPENVKSIRFVPNEQIAMMGAGNSPVQGAVMPHEGDEIDGYLLLNNWTVETDLGQLTLSPSKLRSLTFFRKVDSPKAAAEPAKAEVKVEEKVEKKVEEKVEKK
jgi:hypothetical protein